MDQDKEEIYKKQIETCEQVRNYINALFVNKNKIRDRIEELKKIPSDEYGFVTFNTMKQFAIDELEDLLKE